MGLLDLRAAGARAAVMSLDDEGVFFLELTVHQASRPQLTLTGRPVQHHRLERRLQLVDVERADLSWWRETKAGGKRSASITVHVCVCV